MTAATQQQAQSAQYASEAIEHYTRRRADAGAENARLTARASAISLARVATFAAAVVLALATRFAGFGRGGYAGAVVLLVLFVVLLIIHDRILEKKRRAEGSVVWAEEGLARLEGNYAHDPRPGEVPPPDDHPYAHDLDVIGRGSLLQSIDTTRTVGGRSLLVEWLSVPADAAEVTTRQACAKDLAPRVALREALAVEGGIVAEEPPAIAPLLRWASKGSALRATPLLRAAALLFPAVTLALLIFGGAVPMIPRATWVATLVAQVLFAMRYRAGVSEAIVAASEHQAGLARYARLFAVIENASFDAAPLAEMRARVAAGPASTEIARLGRIVGFVEARRNEVFKLFVGPLLLWDLNCAIALERWRARAGHEFEAHLQSLHRFEALCALATRAHERPDDAWPTVVDDEVVFDARGLGHPLIPAKRAIRNDVTLDGAGFVLLVTGSNMSGKSTLLRSIGTNVALALAGAPVRAHSFRTTSFAVWTSMRVRDSLSEGVSHFLAELKRLKAVADAADAASSGRPVLFLLDEILHGTNSRERHLGAQGIVKRLVTRRATGAISTHDLALGTLEQELPGKVRNVHFREQVEEVDGKETMTFDYQLREGVVTSSNALRLMKIVGLDVDI